MNFGMENQQVSIISKKLKVNVISKEMKDWGSLTQDLMKESFLDTQPDQSLQIP